MGEASFTRDRKLTFKELIVSLIGFNRAGVQTELDRFFKSINTSTSVKTITKSAFTQSRRKLSPLAFVELSKSHLELFKREAPFQKNWKGKRVVAIDGSFLNLPHSKELAYEFGGTKNQYSDIVGAKCSFAYDVCNELVLDSAISRRGRSEKELAVEHLSHLNPVTDILVFDRGYAGLWLIALLEKLGFEYCFRLSTSWQDAVLLQQSGSDDIDWSFSKTSQQTFGKLKEYNLPNKIEGLRLVCIGLKSGEKEILATNLTDRKTYTIDTLKSLYHMRWGVEESYKSFKKVLQIEYFTGKSKIAIEQDFYAKVFMMNLSSMIRSQGLYHKTMELNTKRKRKYQLNKTQSIAKTKDCLVDIFYFNQINVLIHKMLQILEGCFEMVRPERSFPRADKLRRYKGLNARGI